MTIPPREIFDRTPPNDPLAEMSVNGAAILNPAALPEMIEAGYHSGVFHDGDNRQCAAAILAAYADHGTMDKTLLLAALRSHEDSLAGKSAAALLIRTLEATPTAANWPHHLGIVREHWLKRQTFLIGQRMLTGSMNGEAAADIAGEAREALEEISVAGSDPAKRFPSYTLADLAAMDLRTDYLVDGILVKGQPGVIAGAQKTVKTGIAQDLALSLATGGHFLGFFKVAEPQRVCFASGESGLATIRETFERQCTAAGRFLENVSGLFVSDILPRFSPMASDIRAVRRWIVENQATVLFIDPLYLTLDTAGKESSIYGMGQLLRPLGELCGELGITLLVVHHAKRRQRTNGRLTFEPMELDDLAYSGIAEFVRQWMLISKRCEFDKERGSHKLYLNVGGSAGHHGLFSIDIDEGHYPNRGWDVAVSRFSESLQQDRQQREDIKAAKRAEENQSLRTADKTAIVRAVGDRPGTLTDLRNRSGVHPNRMRTVIADLFADRKIRSVKILSSNKQQHDGFALVPDEPENGTGTPPVHPFVYDWNGKPVPVEPPVQYTCAPLGGAPCTDGEPVRATNHTKRKKRKATCTGEKPKRRKATEKTQQAGA